MTSFRSVKFLLALLAALLPAVQPIRAQEDAEDRPGYSLLLDDSVQWKVTAASSQGQRSCHVKTEPPFGLPGPLNRLAVYRQNELLGFVRVRQTYGNGCVLGCMGNSFDVRLIRKDDTLHQFKLVEDTEKDLKPLSRREKRAAEKALSRLGHDTYSIREEATEYLESLGPRVSQLLSEFNPPDDPEVKKRLRRISRSSRTSAATVEPELADILMRWSGEAKKNAEKGFIGISMADVDGGKKPGTKVLGIVKDTPAQKIGLRKDDIILKVNDNVLYDSTDLLELIQGKAPGSKVGITVQRGEKTIELTLELTSRPDKPVLINR